VACSIYGVVEGLASRDWPKTQGIVVNSSVEEWFSARGGYSYTLVANYRYDVGGKRYAGNRVRLVNQRQPGDQQQGLQELAKVAPAGKSCVVYYDPANPTKSCLLPGTSSFHIVFLPLFATLLWSVGGVCLFKSRRTRPGGGLTSSRATSNAAG
jgi:hypothetical protein